VLLELTLRLKIFNQAQKEFLKSYAASALKKQVPGKNAVLKRISTTALFACIGSRALRCPEGITAGKYQV